MFFFFTVKVYNFKVFSLTFHFSGAKKKKKKSVKYKLESRKFLLFRKKEMYEKQKNDYGTCSNFNGDRFC